MKDDAYRRGMKTRRKVLGDEWVDRATRNATPFDAEFQELLTRYAWDTIWNRKGLTRKERRMLVLATTLALGRWEEFRLHMRAALDSGDLRCADVKEILLQSAVYCGVPAANTAFREGREVLREIAARPRAKIGRRTPGK